MNGRDVLVVRYRVTVSGRVQGVWFRESCRRQAAAAGVAGWVRNTVDGRVEAVLEGNEASVRRLVDWMRTGPPHAIVTDVEVRPESPQGTRDFSVR